MQFTLPEQSDRCDNMTLRSYNYIPVLPVKVSRPYFLTRPQARAKHLVSGDETSYMTAHCAERWIGRGEWGYLQGGMHMATARLGYKRAMVGTG